MSENAESHINFIKEKRGQGFTFSAIAAILRNKGIEVSGGTVNAAYNKYKRNEK